MKTKLFLTTVLFTVISTIGVSQEITIFNGFWGYQYYQDDTQISRKQAVALISSDKESEKLWKKSKSHLGIAFAALGAEIGFAIWSGTRASNNESQTLPLIGVIGSAGVAIGYALSSNNLKKKAILKYNKNQDVSSLIFGPTYNGMGLVMSF